MKNISNAQLRALQKIRGDWGGVKPYTRIEKDRKKYNRKEKHKKIIKTFPKINNKLYLDVVRLK